MPSLGGVGKEAITFVLSGDASGLIKTFGDVEKAAEKDLGKTEDHIEKLSATATKVGAASIGVGLSTALGLTSAIKDFEDTTQAANKFQTALKGMGSNIDAGAIQDFAFQLQQVSRFTDDQVVAAARWGAVFGLTTDQLESLLTAAADLSEQTGKSLDFTTKALAKAATGGATKPLEKLGLQFDDTALKANAFKETMAAAGDFAGGAAGKSVDTFSGQLERLNHNWDDVKSQIGAGANEVFQPIVSGAADMTEALAKSNPELLKTVGHFTAIGSIGATAFGGLATVAGQVVNIRDAADGLGIKLKNAEGGLTNLSKGLIGLGAVGAAAALFEVGHAIEDATENTRGFDTALKQLSLAKNIDEQGRAIRAAAEDTKGFFDDAKTWLGTLGGSDELTVRIGKSAVAVHQLNETFDQMADKDPAQALDNLGPALDAVTAKSDQFNKAFAGNDTVLRLNPYADTVSHLGDLKKELEASAKATNQLAIEQGTASDKAILLGTGFDDATDAADGNTDAIQANKDMLKQYQDQVNALNQVQSFVDSIGKIGDANKAAADSFTGLILANAQLGEARKSGDPEKIADAEKDLAKAQEDGKKATEGRTAAWKDYASALDGLVQGGIPKIDEAQARLDDMLKRGIVPPDIAAQMQQAIDVARATVDGAKPISLKVDADTVPANAKLDVTQAKMDALDRKEAKPTADANTEPANTKLDATQAKMDSLDRKEARPTINAHDNVSGVISGVHQNLNALDGKTATVTVNANVQAARQNIADLKSRLEAIARPQSVAPPPTATTTTNSSTTNVTNIVHIPAGANIRDIERAFRRNEARNGRRRHRR